MIFASELIFSVTSIVIMCRWLIWQYEQVLFKLIAWLCWLAIQQLQRFWPVTLGGFYSFTYSGSDPNSGTLAVGNIETHPSPGSILIQAFAKWEGLLSRQFRHSLIFPAFRSFIAEIWSTGSWWTCG